MQRLSNRSFLLLIGILVIGLAVSVAAGIAFANPALLPQQQASPLHPTFALLDQQGLSVLESGQAVSTMQTCGQCHATEFIASHSFHSDLGLSDYTAPGSPETSRPWDISLGLFGKWDPLTYRYLSPSTDDLIDLDTAEWLKLYASRVVGGGPAVSDPDGVSLAASASQTGSWDWRSSGVIEMNCFLCHFSTPNNGARIKSIQDGQFAWAGTATLAGTGIVEQQGEAWVWNSAAFAPDGELLPEYVSIQDPTNDNCAQCHGIVHSAQDEPLVVNDCSLDQWQTATTGQVISPDRISQSGLNLVEKEQQSRSWDIHAERGLQCTDCHYSLNNPAYYQASAESRPEHLDFDPRRLEIGEYLEKPDHNFARGQSAQFTIAPELKETMRRCESCHNAVDTHDWLPYVERHLDELACESCHVPEMYAPAVQSYDYTVLLPGNQPASVCRGLDGTPGTIEALVEGYQPVLMPRQNVDGNILLAPYNLITSWYWLYDQSDGSARPVRLEDLQAAWFEGSNYAPDVVAALDQDGNGALSETELILDSDEKQAVIAARLADLGLANPRITGDIQPYSINHNITHGDWAVQDCKACHDADSRIVSPIKLADQAPGGVLPAFIQSPNTITSGEVVERADGIYYQPATRDQNLYVFGYDRVNWIDWVGALFFVGVLMGVSIHGGLRAYAAMRAPKRHLVTRKVYMYAIYERLWHWLQTVIIVVLLFSGLIIHRPDIFGIFNFRYLVLIHNILAAILVVNAALSLFYHMVSGQIKQFIPHPYGFFDKAIIQAKFYLQGIFKGGPHPFEKTIEKKLNPLQQVTYFGILNILLPLQIITGTLMWGVQRWPEIAGWFGGLPYLAPFHSLIAWLFGSFIVAHVYLTTTAHEPLASIKAMINGWDEIEYNNTENQEVSEHDNHGTIQTEGSQPPAEPEGNPV